MLRDFSAMIYTTEQVRSGEANAAAAHDVSMAQLMQRAAQACLQAIKQQQSTGAQLLILCGPGNNGGDGWVLARLAQQAGYRVSIAAAEPSSDLAKAAAQAWHDHGGSSMALQDLQSQHFEGVDIVVDAMLGNGLSRDLDATYQRVVALLNHKSRGCWVLSVDVPTGLDSDTGCPKPIAVRANKTVTMVAIKVGLVTGQAASFCGTVELADLGVAGTFFQAKPALRAISQNVVRECLPTRDPSSHKGMFGHVLIVGGAPGMSGAATLAGRAALRCGAGKVSVATHASSQFAVAVSQPELMVHHVDDDLSRLLKLASVVVIGPGLGQTAWAQQLVKQVATWEGPVVWDADALNIFAEQPISKPEGATWYFTPHPGEAGRLLQSSAKHVESDRMQALTQLCQNFHAHVLLKGSGTLIQNYGSDMRWVCRRGSPALATGGSGDVLSGVVGAMIAQHVDAEYVLSVSAWLHAVAGENAAQNGERGTLASDLLMQLRALVNPTQQPG
ncbi:NAD(P)H-hydrate dehydratase [Pseudidiomarina sp.]|uniref:NAD(P)H-hydrate dehydratase n=1 Tax=Pseudidiomarina sp. TaxID=2081707 RepID=UPI003A96F012